MKNRFPRRRVLAGALTIPLVLGLVAACSAPAPDDAKGGKSLTVSIGGQPPSFDPAAADLGESAYIWTGLYDTLLKVDVEGAIQPNAAEKWEYSADGLTLTLTLREGLTFSDDSPVTAKDVAATIDRSRTSSGVRAPDLALVSSVEASDERTVVLTLSEGDPALLVNLATGAGIIAKASDLENKSIALSPLESGPYVLNDEATSTGATYVLNRRDDYWNVDAYPYETVTVRVIEDPQARFNALQAGELDAGNVTANQVSAMEAAGFTAKSIEAQAWGGLVFLDRKGERVPALGDKRVRTAIAMAFDRDLYVKQLLQGAGRATDQILNPIQAGYSADLEGYWKYDLNAAKALLAEAGYADGIDLVMPSSYFSTRFEPAITQSLADIGVRVTWEAVPPQEVFASLSSGKYGMAWFFEGLNAPSIMTRSSFSAKGGLNPSGYTSPELDGLFDKLSATPDIDAQVPIYEAINRHGVEDALVAPIFYSSTTWTTKAGVEFLPNGAIPIYLSSFGAN